MGFHVSGDAYTRRFDDITVDQIRVVKCIDDSILWDDIADAFWHTFEYINTYNGIFFNKVEFEFTKEPIKFTGFNITNDGTSHFKYLGGNPELSHSKEYYRRVILVRPCQPVDIHLLTSTYHGTILQSSFIKVIFARLDNRRNLFFEVKNRDH